MRKFGYHKLVRDGVEPGMLDEGCQVESRRLSGEELRTAHRDKIHEEVAELIAEDNAVTAEALADALQSIISYGEVHGIHVDDQFTAIASKITQKGGFATANYIESVSVPDDSPWVTYYEANATRYPEILVNQSQSGYE